MRDFTRDLPPHTQLWMGENDLFLEVYPGTDQKRPPLLFVHGAFTGSWMWSKYLPHFIQAGWTCMAMNLRSHYKSRSMDLTRITFEDYLQDIQEVLSICETPPVLIGFSMGGILGQKIAEKHPLSGLVLIDPVISREVHELVPYPALDSRTFGGVVPAPAREEERSMDESPEDILFQRKYLSMEAGQAFAAFVFSAQSNGISVNAQAITCPTLVIHANNSEQDHQRGAKMAELYRAEHVGLWNTTHTGLLVGQRYREGADAVLDWLDRHF
ncbi:alpha/beta fold hydrolase [Deinococcus cellulosilyticus]|uniref:AB hydrolase-1 domain-containing protein n=1 Tax=Deinococcus cellulosilyticus (strain DSM 18568 / NBRC 106333 / KACC 11606 / 5516J-15) TaxID=1223518 RepID=A0A511MZD3_DEIC1|nr:alpha/beta fold hydrolase [Deinococcus cellulosilyticus]GEM45496.1 hypothetical protein DC3_11310 [Deinococcus cellulosilyticus NBRC 106333 = KACC 11606]